MTDAKDNKSAYQTLAEGVDYLINKIMIENHEYEESYLKKVLTEEQYKNLSDISLTECHIIDCIERNPLTNAVGIAQRMNITKGGISKITSKLLKKNLIEIYRMEGNKKEMFYALTPLGKELFYVHKLMHDQIHEKISRHLTRYTEDEIRIISRFIGDLTEMI